MGVNRNQSIVGCATSQGTGSRIQGALHLGPGRWIETSVNTAIRGLVSSLEVASLTLLISIVLNKKVPGQIGIL